MNWYEKRVKELGYMGCRNCKLRDDHYRTCKWNAYGGDGQLHLICTKWCTKWQKKVAKINEVEDENF